MTPKQMAKEVGITDLRFEDWENKGLEFNILQVRRRVRYYCGAMRRKADGETNKVRVPKKLIEYFESHPSFEGWDKFSRSWDISRDNPLDIYYRDFSVEEEWDATLRRVVPELPVDRKMRRTHGPEGNV